MYSEARLQRLRSLDSDNLTVFASGLALGLLVGGGVALLFAPAPGTDVRHAIARRGKHARQRGSDAWDDLRHEFRRMARRRRRHRDEQDDD
jgi:gas vesicle protein